MKPTSRSACGSAWMMRTPRSCRWCRATCSSDVTDEERALKGLSAFLTRRLRLIRIGSRVSARIIAERIPIDLGQAVLYPIPIRHGLVVGLDLGKFSRPRIGIE